MRSGALFPEGRVPDPTEGIDDHLLVAGAEADLLLVSEVASTVVGFALCEPGEDSLHLAQLSVLPEYGRRGIGRALVNTVIDLARKRGEPRVTLTTFSDLAWNGPFYASAGFKTLARSELGHKLLGYIEREESLGMVNRVAMAYDIA